jgi:hypothetical protein
MQKTKNDEWEEDIIYMYPKFPENDCNLYDGDLGCRT